ncbi:uncharacterized protein ATNIH1004_009704 [Aspergillus tanneri]|uniref:ATP-grasp domain-containing protein n=1 Tax=Aspergillus tanneri TaxID=1220188 RepID=A0A5M9MDD0_9EURO|nr:uncharacterized protein ATNIH1004_009704 [Aspergillus tanneri]KAA8642943.1 hypothetical protein ATNIH1004_009704 [Aspergillus tanneri]
MAVLFQDIETPDINGARKPRKLGVKNCDDKAYLNDKLQGLGTFVIPRSWLVTTSDNLDKLLSSMDEYPIVGKPVRGRGSHGVKVCHNPTDLKAHVEALLVESPLVMIEELLAGNEATITVKSPSSSRPQHWSMTPVIRFNHVEGVAPYNGVVAVTTNSRVITDEEMKDPAYSDVMRQFERVAQLIRATAPIRIDVRRFHQGSRFALFDINMKPNMTGPGRPGREDQAGLTAISAAALGWDYGALLENILGIAQPLDVFRRYRSPFERC